MTHDQLIKIERATHRAILAARIHADKDTCKLLDHAEYLLAEIRHCGKWLCGNEGDDDAKARFASFFQMELE